MGTKCASCGKPLPPRTASDKPDETAYCQACAMKILEGHNTSRTETRVAIQTELQSESMADVYGPGSAQSATMSDGPRWVNLSQEKRRRRRRVYSTGRKVAGASIFLGTTIYGAIILTLAFSNRPVRPHEPAIAKVVHVDPPKPVVQPKPAVVTPAPVAPAPVTPAPVPAPAAEVPPAEPQQSPVAVVPSPTHQETPAPIPAPVAVAPSTPVQTPAPTPTPASSVSPASPTPAVAEAPRPVTPAPAPVGNRKATSALSAPDEVGGGDIKLSIAGGTIANITPGAWARWDNIDFGSNGSLGSVKVLMKVTSAEHKIDVRLDDPESGPVIATLQTGNPSAEFKPLTGSIDDVAGKHSVYLVFGNFDSGEVQSLTFLPEVIAVNAKPIVVAGARMTAPSAPGAVKVADAAITATKANAWARFDKVDFGTGVGYRTILLGVRGTQPNQKVIIKLDDAAKGRTLATVNVPTGNNPGPVSVVVSGAPVSGMHNLFIIFTGTATTLQTVTFRP